MADPTPAEVHAALAVLAAAEAAREAHVEPTPVVPASVVPMASVPVSAATITPASPVVVETPALAEEIPTPTLSAAAAVIPASTGAAPPAAPVAIDPYLARSVKSSPNGF